jgi:hypothetical protein
MPPTGVLGSPLYSQSAASILAVAGQRPGRFSLGFGGEPGGARWIELLRA